MRQPVPRQACLRRSPGNHTPIQPDLYAVVVATIGATQAAYTAMELWSSMSSRAAMALGQDSTAAPDPILPVTLNPSPRAPVSNSELEPKRQGGCNHGVAAVVWARPRWAAHGLEPRH